MMSRSAEVVALAVAVTAACALAVPLAGCPSKVGPANEAEKEVVLQPEDRILVLAPHPDDETLGCGGVIQQGIAMKLPVRVVFFTYGDNNQWSFLVYRKIPVLRPKSVRAMGMVRHGEAITAANILGLTPDRLTFLGYPDFGALRIWLLHWGEAPPYRSMLTEVEAVPYSSALSPGAPYRGESILRDLTTVLREFRPTKIFLPHPADHNPDHLALYLFTRVALWDLEQEMQPELYPYLVHFPRWPRPRGLFPDEKLEPPAAMEKHLDWRRVALSPGEIQRKLFALEAHRSQFQVSAPYLLSFVRQNELFGDFPPLAISSVQALAHLSPDSSSDDLQPPDGLTEEERSSYLGFEDRSIGIEDGRFVLSLTVSRPLAQTVGVAAYIFGYRSDRPFAAMPKLRLRCRAGGEEMLDGDRLLSPELFQVERRPRRIVIRVPLSALGDPDRILTGARSILGEIPLDWASWRVVDLRR